MSKTVGLFLVGGRWKGKIAVNGIGVDVRYNFDTGTGSLSEADCLLVYSLIKSLCPRVAVEFGFLNGVSAKVILSAMNFDGRLYSYDITDCAEDQGRKIKDSRFRFIRKAAQEFAPSDVGNSKVDFVLFDAAHSIYENIETYSRISGAMSEQCMIVVHDTGLFFREFMDSPWEIPGSYYVGDSGYAHRPQERMFVNYLREVAPELHQIHIHTDRIGSFGLTIMKKFSTLTVSESDRQLTTKITRRSRFLDKMKRVTRIDLVNFLRFNAFF